MKIEPLVEERVGRYVNTADDSEHFEAPLAVEILASKINEIIDAITPKEENTIDETSPEIQENAIRTDERNKIKKALIKNLGTSKCNCNKVARMFFKTL